MRRCDTCEPSERESLVETPGVQQQGLPAESPSCLVRVLGAARRCFCFACCVGAPEPKVSTIARVLCSRRVPVRALWRLP